MNNATICATGQK